MIRYDAILHIFIMHQGITMNDFKLFNWRLKLVDMSVLKQQEPECNPPTQGLMVYHLNSIILNYYVITIF